MDASIVVRMIDETRAGFAGIQANLDRTDRSINGLQGQFDSLRRSTSGLTDGIIGLGTAIATSFVTKAIVSTAAEFESLRASIGAVTKDVKIGNAIFEELKDISVETVFGVKDLSAAFIKMAAAGVAPTKDQLKLFNDVASVSADRLGTLQAITDLFARTVGGGLGLEELNRLADRGIPVYKILSEQLGVTREQLSKLGQSAEGAKIIVDALQVGLQKDYGGAAATQAGTLSKAFSDLKDAASNAADAVGTAGLNDAIKDVANSIRDYIKANPEAVKAIGTDLANAVKFLKENFDNVITAIGIFFGIMVVSKIVAMVEAIIALGAAVAGLAAAFNRIPFAAIATALGVLALGAVTYATNTDKASESTDGFGTKLVNGIKSLLGFGESTKTATGATQAQIREIDNATTKHEDYQGAVNTTKGAVDQFAEGQKTAKEVTIASVFASMSLAQQMDVLTGKTQLYLPALNEQAKRAQDLVNGTKGITTAFGEYIKKLEEGIAVSEKDAVAKRIQSEVTKALEAAQKDAKQQNFELTDAIKNNITETVRQKIVTDETSKAMIKATEALAEAEAKNKDSIGQYLFELEKLRKDHAGRTIQNQDIFNKELEALRLKHIANDIKFQRDAYRNNLTDLEKFNEDVLEAEKKRQQGIYTSEQELNNQMVALRTNYEQKYKTVIEQARTVNMTETEKYLDRLRTLEEEANSKGLAGSIKNYQARLAEEKIFRSAIEKEAQDYRIKEGGATAAYQAKLLELQAKFNAATGLSEEDKNTLLRKLNKEYVDAISNEYSTLYGDLNNQILKFTGQTQEQFNRTKEIVKLVFGVDLDTVIKTFFANAIKYLLGFQTATEGSVGTIGGIFGKLFGSKGDAAKSVLDFTDVGDKDLKDFSSGIPGLFGGLGKLMSGIFNTDNFGIGSLISKGLDLFKGFGSSILDIFSGVGGFIGKLFGSTGSGSILGTIGSAIGGLFGGGGGASAGGGLLGTIGSVVGGIGSVVGGIGGAIGSAAGGLISGIGGALAGLGPIGLLVGGLAALFGGGSSGNINADAQKEVQQTVNSRKAVEEFYLKYDVRPPAYVIDPTTGDLLKDAKGNPILNNNTAQMLYKITDRDTGQSQFRLLNLQKISKNFSDYYRIGPGAGYDPGSFQSDLAYYLGSGKTTYGALGLAYSMGNLTNVTGGLINSATMFKTNRGLAIGGELGTEAIMPLSRGPDGRLGVSANGGNNESVQVNITINAVDAKGIDQLLVERRQMLVNIIRSAAYERGRSLV